MKARAWLAAALTAGLASAACAPARTQLVAAAPPPHELAPVLTAIPGFVLVPAVDRRPAVERDGVGPELGYIMASTGAAMSQHAGAAVLGGDDGLRWTQAGFPGVRASAATAVAADLGHALQRAAARPVSFAAGDAEGAARDADDGTVVVSIVIDHIAKITPRNDQFSKTTSQQGNYEVTTTTTSSSSLGPFWTVTLRLQLGQVRDGRIVRRLVRYASATAVDESGYGAALSTATAEVIEAVALEWAITPGPPSGSDDDAVTPGL